ncbi:MAG: hypothetical protein K0Q55_4107 [Verrucomicrobia bacterium]|jgi:hypothetical protein|nr:hypothetical protein [Verrucomicrobiota bacterium]
MRALLWLLCLAFAIECVTTAMLASFVMTSLDGQGSAAPGFTGLFFRSPKVWLVVPLPWIIATIWLTRRPVPPSLPVFLCIGTLAVAAAVVLGIMVIASVLPMLPLK